MDATACCIGHTHIDVAWLWRLRQTREKAGRSFATVLKLMEEYPEYKFMSSQAQLYAFVKEDYPEVYEGIKKMIAEGRWEVEGSMWVESDTNVTSGESLVRQFLVGKRFFKDEFGVDNKIMWLPDVFGYSAALPQIMKKAGIDYFMTTKISWNEFNKVPYDTFMWKGIDGTEILSHFSPSTDCFDEGDCWQTTYNAYLNPEHILGGWHRYSQKDLNKEYLCTFALGRNGSAGCLVNERRDVHILVELDGEELVLYSLVLDFNGVLAGLAAVNNTEGFVSLCGHALCKEHKASVGGFLPRHDVTVGVDYREVLGCGHIGDNDIVALCAEGVENGQGAAVRSADYLAESVGYLSFALGDELVVLLLGILVDFFYRRAGDYIMELVEEYYLPSVIDELAGI